jgi:hypothetical protein
MKYFVSNSKIFLLFDFFFVQVRVDFVDTSLLPPEGGICLDQQLTGVQKT